MGPTFLLALQLQQGAVAEILLQLLFHTDHFSAVAVISRKNIFHQHHPKAESPLLSRTEYWFLATHDSMHPRLAWKEQVSPRNSMDIWVKTTNQPITTPNQA